MKYLMGLASKLGLIFFFFFNWITAQNITVVDAITQSPLSNVSIYNQTKEHYTLTDLEGKASLSSFSQEDKISIQYLGYKLMTIDKTEFDKLNYIVSLIMDSKELSEVILSVARTPTAKNKIAEKVSIIDTKHIKRNQPQTGAELLLAAPNIRIQKSQGGGGSPVLRGFEANRVLLVVDGVRMNNAIYRSGHLQNAITVDPNTIERVEVVYGSSSVGYGSDALGGVVHYYTKTPRINSSELIKNNFSSNYNSAQSSYITHFDTEFSFKNWAGYSSISFSEFGDLRMGKNKTHGYTNWGGVPFYSLNTESFYDPAPAVNNDPYIQRNSGYNQIDFLQKFVFKLPKEKLLTFNIQYSNSSNIPRFDKLNEYRNGSLRYAEWYYGPQKRFLISSQLKLFPKKKLLYKGRLTLAYQDVKESRINRSYNSLIRSYQKENVRVWSFNGNFEVFKKDPISFAYGFELVGNNIDSDAFSRRLILRKQTIIRLSDSVPILTRYPNAGSSYNSNAFYGNLKWDINRKATLTAGARYTETNLKAIWDGSNRKFSLDIIELLPDSLTHLNVTNDAFTGSLSLTYRPFAQWQLNFLLSSGFRTPNIDDLGKIRESRGVLLAPNPSLKPEYANNIDLGASFFTFNKKGAFSLRLYNTSIKDYIGREFIPDYYTEGEFDAIQVNANVGNTYIQGASFEGKWNFTSHISLSSDVTFTNAGEIDSFGPLPSILPFYGTTKFEYKKNKLSAQLLHQFSSSKKPENYSLGGEDGIEETPIIINNFGEEEFIGSPSWSVLSVSGRYQWGKKIILRTGIENIFDIHYKTFASGVSASGRSLILGVSAAF